MPTTAFLRQDEIGRWFEDLMMPYITKAAERMGYSIRVIDTKQFSYWNKKGRDRILQVQGERNSIEFKLDLKSNFTRRVCVDWESLNDTDSTVWVFGLPEGEELEIIDLGKPFLCGRYLKTYSMETRKLYPFVMDYTKNHPECWWLSGEHQQKNPMVDKGLFLLQTFVAPFVTIDLLTREAISNSRGRTQQEKQQADPNNQRQASLLY